MTPSINCKCEADLCLWLGPCISRRRADGAHLRRPERLELSVLGPDGAPRRAHAGAARARRALVQRRRGQWVSLPPDRARMLRRVGRADTAWVPLRREGSPLRNALQAAVGLR